MISGELDVRFVLDTCSVRAASGAQLAMLADRGEILIPPVVVYELLRQVRGQDGSAARGTIRALLDVPHTVGSEAMDLTRSAFALEPLPGSSMSAHHAGVLMRWVADRGSEGLVEVWQDFWRRGLVAHAPDNPDAWKGSLGETYRSQIATLAREERERAKRVVEQVVAIGVAEGREPPERKVRRAMEGYVHDTLLESSWPSVRLVHLMANAVGLESVHLERDYEFDGSDALAETCNRYGYVGGLEFACRAYTFLVDRYIFGHNGHRNDFADSVITLSVSKPGDVFVTEEQWWRAYLGPSEVCPIGVAASANWEQVTAGPGP